MKRKSTVLIMILALMGSVVFAGGQQEGTADAGKTKIVLLVKSLGNGFFEAVADGGVEAAGELGDVESVYMGPSSATAEGQIEIIETLIAQKVDGIAISANDPDALIPVCKKAMKAGIRIMSFDSNINAGGREVALAPSDSELIGTQQVRLIAELCDYKGKIAVLSATAQATNQNEWIGYMQEAIKAPEYKDMEIVEIAYGDDAADKSYREAVGLFKKYPDLAGIISPTTVGVLAASKAIEDEGLKGKVQITGLGLPSEMQHYIENGTCGQMALWNPVDLGYSATYILNSMIKGEVEGKSGDVIKAGRMGEIRVGNDGNSIMGEPFVFNKENIAQYASIF